jgi:hypothetical protein
MTTTPSTIHAAVERLWQERPECRPRFLEAELTFVNPAFVGSSHEPLWVYRSRRKYPNGNTTGETHLYDCDDATAAERIEFGVDRLLEEETHKRQASIAYARVGGAYCIQFKDLYLAPECNILFDFRSDNRLFAKLKLAYSLCGIEPPEVLK